MQKIGDPGYRVDTGTIQFDEDWPGVFVRGDDAMGKSNLLRIIARTPNKALPDHEHNARAKFLLELADFFASADISAQP